MFTKEQIKELARELGLIGKKDTQFEQAEYPLHLDDTIAIVQDSRNKRAPISWLLPSTSAFQKDLEVKLYDGKTFGRFVDGDIIQSLGKSPIEVIEDAVTEVYNGPLIYYWFQDNTPIRSMPSPFAIEIDIDEVPPYWQTSNRLRFRFLPNQEIIHLIFPSALELETVLSDNSEYWYNKKTGINYFNHSIDYIISGVPYTEYSVNTNTAMEIEAVVTFKEITT